MRARALSVGIVLFASAAVACASAAVPAATARHRVAAVAAGKHHARRVAGVAAKKPDENRPSSDAWHVIDWVIASHDNNGMPFVVVDKVAAELFLFDPSGQMIGAAPALVGMTVGDEATPGTGDRELSKIPPEDRKTPAGRFVAKFGPAAGGREVLWVDYPAAISIHGVIKIANQHRLERLNSPTPDDNRITYGCINVPTKFYAKLIEPLFKKSSGVVYVLPETEPPNAVFPAMPSSAPSSAD